MKLKKELQRAMMFILALILIFSIYTPTLSTKEKNITITADGINLVRNSGTIIIYTSEYGETTKTNEWGSEVVVGADNIVTKVGGHDNKIPEDGFVLSGHNADTDKRGVFLDENVEVGDYVYFNANNSVVSISSAPKAQPNFYKLEREIDGVNIKRNADFLVIFNELGKNTDTNQWGLEIVCEDGVVTSIGGNNLTVPKKEGSFIISGHGKNAEWLTDNIRKGMSVTYDLDKKTITFSYDENAALYGINISINELEVEFEKSKTEFRFIDFDDIDKRLSKLKTEFDLASKAFLDGGKIDDFEAACNDAEVDIKKISDLLFESLTVEYRVIWVRPKETTVEAVDNYVEELYNEGINVICIEMLYNSTMIMPMPKDSLFEQNPDWKGFDMLQAYIDACHKRDMELHLWFPIFKVGNPNTANTPKALSTKKPEWLSADNKGNFYPESSETKYYMISPANKEATDYLLETYRYILENYNIDGFQLDYIRYRATLASEGIDYGYDDVTLDLFEEEYNIRPEYDPKADYWEDWVKFRASFVTQMVKSIRELIDEVRPSVLLTADVGAGVEEAYRDLYQDYMTWVEAGYIDILHPMAYGNGYDGHIKRQVQLMGDTGFIVVGRSTQMREFKPHDILRLAKEANLAGADGTAFFEASSYLSKHNGPAFTASMYRNKAITPTLNKKKAFSAYLEYLTKGINEVILPLNGLSNEESTLVLDAIAEMEKALDEDEALDNAIKEAIKTVEGLQNQEVVKKLNDCLAYATKMANVMERVPDRVDRPVLEHEDDDISKDDDESIDQSDSSDSSEDSDGEKDKKESDISKWIIFGGIALVLAGVAAAIVIRKKKQI